MKTKKELIEMIKEREGQFMDFFPEVLMEFLSFEDAKPYLNEMAIEEMGEKEAKAGWHGVELTEENVKKHMADYMEFAWEKALNHRGLSANRSVSKMQAYTWILGRDEEIDWDNYANYGAPILKQICKMFDLPVPENPALARMAEGMPCDPEGCEMGCGS